MATDLTDSLIAPWIQLILLDAKIARDNRDAIAYRESEIAAIERELRQREIEVLRRPSLAKHIANLTREKRRREIEIAFYRENLDREPIK